VAIGGFGSDPPLVAIGGFGSDPGLRYLAAVTKSAVNKGKPAKRKHNACKK
jgi:hypothetical protein